MADNPAIIDTENARANQILEVILAFARQDFSVQSPIIGDGGSLDAIASGVNMLGEELKSSSVSLREKDQLLKEIHHRVKNNLQIIYSLLNLQSDFVTDPNQLLILKECQNRIKSMALVHEMLYSSADLSGISLESYINSLAHHLSFTYVKPVQRIEVINSTDKSISLKIDQMIPLGLVLNEIVSNSLKHAFHGDEGKIMISTMLNGDSITVNVSDNGRGLPKGFNHEKDGNLGMQLIFLLAEQLDADVKLHSDNGVHYAIKFEL